MSNRYKGGIISATPPTTNGPFEDGAASGAWTLEQQMQAAAAGTWPLAGNVSPDAFIENLFQTWLYTGNDAYQAINNGIDLAGKGGLVWSKSRSTSGGQFFYDSARGATTGNAKSLTSNTTAAQVTTNPNSMNFISSGFELASNASSPGNLNASGETAVSWTFRKQPKFFDVVTYTGNGANRNIAHNLGSAPGCVIVKCTSTTGQWAVWHRSGTQLNNFNAYLNTTQGYADAAAGIWGVNGGVPSMTSTTFSLGTDSDVNTNGETYVAYLFAHDAGGFGLTGTDNVISCGSYTGNGSTSGPVIDLGYEPQWIMIKRATGGTANWGMFDNMRGAPVSGPTAELRANTSEAENDAAGNQLSFTATGFKLNQTYSGINTSGSTYIYIAIRRGPMKVPTTGTSVFAPVTATQPITSSSQPPNPGFTTDLMYYKRRNGDAGWLTSNRLAGGNHMFFNSTTDESDSENIAWDVQTGWRVISSLEGVSNSYSFGYFRRAPGFFDEVCYTGNGTTQAPLHNLTRIPELLIVKRRSGTGGWATLATNASVYGYINSSGSFFAASTGINQFGNGTVYVPPTSTAFTVGPDTDMNGSGSTYVAYLFASCPGVSKVGSYTGTAATQVINCGFTGGARFILIKRTDASGDWYVWDSARGIVAGDDPYLLLNSTAAEVTNTDFVDTASTGFEISSTAPAAINASGGTFVFLAIA